MKKKFKLLSLLLALATVFSLMAMPTFAYGDDDVPPLTMELDENGKMSITRREIGNTPMGEEDTWTIFVYMCGSNLESKWSYATDNILAMIDGENPENCRFIIQTGGSYEWNNNLMEAGEIGRYAVYDGDIETLDRLPDEDMGDGYTLLHFLQWGIENYPAEKMGLILWDHGGGSLWGVCQDEVYDNDIISLSDLNVVFDILSDDMTDKFEFIGFDACLMSTLECAALYSTYARYMYASEETEPGCGWDYSAIANALKENPGIDGAELGLVVADSFVENCDSYDAVENCTFSITDLSKIDDVLIAFNDYSKELYESTGNNDSFTAAIRSIRKVDNYGGNNRADGYSNQIDLDGFAKVGTDWLESTDALVNAIDKAVLYYINGMYHADAQGLSMYFPIKLYDEYDLDILHMVTPSPYYLAFIDRMAYAMTHGGNLADYDGLDTVLGSWCSYWTDYGSASPIQFMRKTGIIDYFSQYDLYYDFDSDLFSFDMDPCIAQAEDGNAYYCFILSDEGYNNLNAVYGTLSWYAEEEDAIVELGLTGDVSADWDEKLFLDGFDGYWFSLPDGQNLATYIVQEDEEFAIYSSPVILNGDRTNLRIVRDYENNYLYVEGCWDGIASSGMASRNWVNLEEGDIIQPVYYSTNIETDDEDIFYGRDYVYDGDENLQYSKIFDGTFFYGFVLEDVFGNYYETDMINVVLDTEGNITFEDYRA